MEQLNSSIKQSFVIVGSGPAGLIAGILLCRQGHTVLILEAQSESHRPVCGEYLSPEGVQLLGQLGLQETMNGFKPVWGMALVSPSGIQVEAEFPSGRCGVSLNRQIFQERLRTIFMSSGGTLKTGKRVERIDRIPTGFRIQTLGCSAVYEAHALIGADGRKSTVARLLGLKEEKPVLSRVAMHCYLKPKRPLSRMGQMHILEDGSYVGINPINEDEVYFSIVTDVSNIKGSRDWVSRINSWISSQPRLSEQFDLLVDEPVHVTYPITRIARDVCAERVALIGDASGFIDPLTGEGVTTAIKTASLLGERLARTSSINEAMKSYASSRKTQYRQKELLNRILQKVIRKPWLCELIAFVFQHSKVLRTHFIGVIGNVYTPLEAFKNVVLFKSGKGV